MCTLSAVHTAAPRVTAAIVHCLDRTCSAPQLAEVVLASFCHQVPGCIGAGRLQKLAPVSGPSALLSSTIVQGTALTVGRQISPSGIIWHGSRSGRCLCPCPRSGQTTRFPASETMVAGWTVATVRQCATTRCGSSVAHLYTERNPLCCTRCTINASHFPYMVCKLAVKQHSAPPYNATYVALPYHSSARSALVRGCISSCHPLPCSRAVSKSSTLKCQDT